MPGDVVGTAYVTIRAITAGIAKDIEDGVKKGAAEADVDSAGKEVGGKFSKGFNDQVEKDTSKTVSKHIEKSVSKTSGDSGVKNASNKVGRAITQNLFQGILKGKGQVANVFKDMGHTALAAFQFPKGKLDWIGVLGVPALGGAIQIASASLGTLAAALGQLVFASAGAGIALGGMFAALGVGILPIVLAFKAGGDAAEDFKARMSDLTKPFTEIGEATMTTLAPGLEAAVTQFQTLIPLMSSFGATQGEVIGGIASVTAAVLTSSENMSLWREGLSQVQTVFKNLGNGAVGLADALPLVFTSAMPIAQQFSDSLGQMGLKFGQFIKETGKGNLTKTFQGWYDAAAQVMRTLGNVALGLLRILDIGAERTGESMFDKFEKFSKKFNDWTKSVKGNNAIKGFFDRSSKVMSEVGLILGDIGKALFGPIKGAAKSTSVVGTLEAVRKEWIPPLKEIIEQIRQAGQLSFENIIDEIGRFLDILAENPGLVNTALSTLSINMGVFTAALKLLNTVLDSGVGKALFNFFGPLIPLFVLANKMKIGKLATDVVGFAKSLDAIKFGRGGVADDIRLRFMGIGESIDGAKAKFAPFQSAVAGVASAFGGYMAGMAKDTGTMVAGIGVALAGVGSALARGDWIGAGVAAVTAGIGFIIGRWNRGQKEAQARADAMVKSYKSIRDQVNDVMSSAFEDAGTADKSSHAAILLKTLRDSIAQGIPGAKNFSKAFNVSMDQVIAAAQGGEASWRHFVVQTRRSEIIDVMHGNAKATEVWGKAMKIAGTEVNKTIQGLQWQDLDLSKSFNASGIERDGKSVKDALQGTIETVQGLGDQLAKGKISWDEFATGALAAGATMTDLKPLHDDYWDSLSNSMDESTSLQFIKTLRPELQAVAKEQLALIEVNKKLAIEEEKLKPPVQVLGESFKAQKDKAKELADEYLNIAHASEDFAASMAGTALSVASSADTIFGNIESGQEGLSNSTVDQLKRTQETAEAHTDFATAFTAEATRLVATGKGTYGQLMGWQEHWRQQQIKIREEAGMPVDDAFLKWLDEEVMKMDNNIAFDVGVISQLNGAQESPEKIKTDIAAMNEIVAIHDQKEFNQRLLTHVTENGVPSPLEQQMVTARKWNQDLAGMNGTTAQTNAYHLVKENTKNMSAQEIAKWAETQRLSLKNLNLAKADTTARHAVSENTKKAATEKITRDMADLRGELNRTNGKGAATSGKHGASENGQTKPTSGITDTIKGLRDELLTLHGKSAASSSDTTTRENGVGKPSRDIMESLYGIGSAVDSLNGKTARATIEVGMGGVGATLITGGGGGRFILGAEGGYFNKPTSMVIGEAGPEVLLPLKDQARSMQLLTKYAPELVGSNVGSSLDRMVLQPGGSSTSSTTTTGNVTGLNIENATFQDGTDADLVAARIRSSLRLLGVT